MNEGLIYLMDAGIAIFEIYVIMIFFDGIWKRKECSRALKIIILLVTILGFFGASVLLKNSSLLLVAGCMICLILSFFYETTYLQRLFFITIFIVISGVTEILTIYIISGIGKIALENIQSISNIYFISALLSKLLLFCSVKV